MQIVIDKILPLFIIVAGNINRLELKFCDLTHLHPQCVVDELDHYGVCLMVYACGVFSLGFFEGVSPLGL